MYRISLYRIYVLAIQYFYSLSSKTSYRQIPWRLKATRLDVTVSL